MTKVETERVHRPRDRKQRIIAAAARLFRDRGYHDVSLADIAGEVGITGPALYKHVSNKEELLLLAVHHGLDDLDAAARNATTIDEFIDDRVRAAREKHTLVSLWQRQSRHLPTERRDELRGRVNGVGQRIAALVQVERPELDDDDSVLLSWALLSVFAGLATHRIALPRQDLENLLRAATQVVVHEYQPRSVRSEAAEPAVVRGPVVAVSRREQLLTSAIRLIDERGFHSVNMTDIGAAVGITGPSVYKHFPSKTDLLITALVRGSERLQSGMEQALAQAESPSDALDRLLRAQIRFAREHSHMISILISERDQLPDKERQATYRVQRDILETWVGVLEQAAPGLSPAEARITVNMVFALINHLVRTPRLAARADLDEQLLALSRSLLNKR